jgi:8-oxo-dGTP pyrophosphatase MutT (NUDIX family)
MVALKLALEAPLPGAPAQRKMSPPYRITHPLQGIKTRTSAVLVLMYPTSHGIHLPFTLRLSTLAYHAGEICFPGGGFEEGDPTLNFTALRESEEELGLDAKSVRILGSMTPIYVSASYNIIHPVIGWADERPIFTPSPDEVERVIEVPLQTLLDPRNVGEYSKIHNGQTFTVPCYRINSECIWGATAMILSEFLLIVHTHILSKIA